MKVKTKARPATGGRSSVKSKFPGKKRDSHLITRKRFCRFCADKIKAIDYKDSKRMEAFLTERGKIVSSRISGNCAKHQRRICEAIKKGRFLSLLPYTK